MKRNTTSNRQFRVGEEIRHAVADIFMRGELHMQEMEKYSITISEVRVSPDLKNATVFVMPLGGVDKELVLKWLAQIAPLARNLLARKVYIKYLPKIKFVLDNSFEEAGRIEQMLNSDVIKKDLNDNL